MLFFFFLGCSILAGLNGAPADSSDTTEVVIEVPKELPNRPRIETSDFSETMNACLLDAVRHLTFPGDPEGAAYRLRIPFRFRPD